MKKLLLLTIISFCTLLNAQKLDTLNLYYLNNSPFAFEENGKVSGLEIDLITEYANWLKVKKNIDVYLNYKSFTNFDELYSAVKKGDKKTIGLSTVTINEEREKEVDFSPAYLKNTTLLITNGTVATIKSKNVSEVNKVLGNLEAVTVANSTYLNYLNELKKTFIPGLKINTVSKISEITKQIANNPKMFGYVDVVNFWYFIKNNYTKYLKIQKVFNKSTESFGFIMPKNGLNKEYISEFFESGFGFTSTKSYHQILEKYLSFEVLQSVEVDN